MCRVFSDKLEAEKNVVFENDFRTLSNYLPFKVPLAKDGTADDKPLQKRRASTSLQHEPSKVVKCSDEDDSSSTTSSFQTLSSSAFASGIEATPAEQKLQDLEKNIEELENERNKWRVKAFNLNNEVADLRKRLDAKASKNQASGRDLSKQLENDIKAKWEGKLQKQKEEHDHKFEKMKAEYQRKLNGKQQGFQDKLDDLKEKQQTKLDDKEASYSEKYEELKEKDQNREKENKKTKAEYQQLEKELRAESAAKIREARPETNKLVKEQQRELKKSEDNISELRQTVKKMGSKESRLESKVEEHETEIGHLENDVWKEKQEKKKLEKLVSDQYQAIEKLKEARLAMLGEHQQKLKHEGEKWQLQHNKAINLEQKLIGQYRTNFVLRQGNARQAKTIEGLKTKLQHTKERTSGPANRVVEDATVSGADTFPHDEYSERLIDKGMEVKHADVSQSDSASTTSNVEALVPGAGSGDIL